MNKRKVEKEIENQTHNLILDELAMRLPRPIHCKGKLEDIGGLELNNPPRHAVMVSKYPSTCSDDWFEHLLKNLGLVK